MPAFTGDFDVEHVRGRKKRPRANGKLTCWHLGPIVHAVNLINAKALHHAVIAHFFAAAAALFGGLENHHSGAVKVSRLAQVLRCAQEHRGMTIVTAGMHSARRFAGIFKTGLLLDGQRVHVGA